MHTISLQEKIVELYRYNFMILLIYVAQKLVLINLRPILKQQFLQDQN